jgi:hypothetical protein
MWTRLSNTLTECLNPETMMVENLLPTKTARLTALSHTRYRMMAARPGRWIVHTVIFALAGCSEPDAIRVHDETPPPQPQVRQIPDDQKQFRTLAAMVPADGMESGPSWWFFKMSGSAAIVGKYQSDFDKLLNSIQSTSDAKDPVTWELPGGWTQGEKTPKSMRFATLKSPTGDAEIAVTRFGGTVLANAQRWWGELWGTDKAQDFTIAMMSEHIQQRTVKGRLVLRVDMSGPNEPPKRPMMPMMDNPHGGMEE